MHCATAILQGVGAARWAACFRSAARGLAEGSDGKSIMDFLGGPAALGEIAACVALVAWTLGRWRGGARAVEPAQGPAPAGQHPPFEWRVPVPDDAGGVTGSQHAHRAGREVWLETAFSPGELHAEVSAYRRQQNVFAAEASDALHLALRPAGARPEGHDLVLLARPTGAMPSAMLPACGVDGIAAKGRFR